MVDLDSGTSPAPERLRGVVKVQPTIESGRLTAMDYVERGQAIRRRRLALGFKSLREFSEATGLSREAVSKAEEGTASPGTYQRLEAWLDAYEHENGEEGQQSTMEQVIVVVDGERVEVTVNGPVRDPDALEAYVARIVRSIRTSSPPATD